MVPGRSVSAPARSDDPVSSSVRFNREIVRIFQRKCVSCHAKDTIAMPLTTDGTPAAGADTMPVEASHVVRRMAKAAAGECTQLVFESGFQLFGGIGSSGEHGAHLYYRRAWAAERLSGGPHAHRGALTD